MLGGARSTRDGVARSYDGCPAVGDALPLVSLLTPPPPLYPRGYLVRGLCNFFSRFCRQSRCGVASVILQPHVCWEGLSRTLVFFLLLFIRWGSTLRAWRAPALCVHDATGTASLSSERATWCELVGISVH
ncbi:uncharacterized protein CCOS01_09632 [Colletotrichum costaricense]|uniref:Uncharacterized protein n=1 Tax=Colletotrichum costaricense TaxID=1209916 RepID=A0AAJ0DYQ2_9PEZI|nr:uncharacterized protein CCOS01_09632 [Colletotrichum costaricense]KAK1521920.1 hypothetical protein CCOS01_09632 [Colletotrichum costaricense]